MQPGPSHAAPLESQGPNQPSLATQLLALIGELAFPSRSQLSKVPVHREAFPKRLPWSQELLASPVSNPGLIMLCHHSLSRPKKASSLHAGEEISLL